MRKVVMLIINDQKYAQYLKEALIDNYFEVLIEDSALDSLEKLEKNPVDAIVANYEMDHIRGDDYYKKLYSIEKDIPVIFLSHNKDRKTIKKILSHPNAEYMVLPIHISEFIARIEYLMEEKKKTANSTVLKVGDLKLDTKTFKASINGEKINLSPTEFSLLKYLMINQNNVLTRNMLLGRIWGFDTEVSTRVVDVYVGYLRNKIDKDNDNKMIKTVRGFGYMISAKT